VTHQADGDASLREQVAHQAWGRIVERGAEAMSPVCSQRTGTMVEKAPTLGIGVGLDKGLCRRPRGFDPRIEAAVVGQPCGEAVGRQARASRPRSKRSLSPNRQYIEPRVAPKTRAT